MTEMSPCIQKIFYKLILLKIIHKYKNMRHLCFQNENVNFTFSAGIALPGILLELPNYTSKSE